ncbi:MAG: histidine kinase [Proteobacteria bacterium]|nr:histidine kinase [Pseudomonadota bacterium]
MNRIDWRLLAMGLPKRRFTAEELARARPEPLNLTLRLVALLNALPLVGALLWVLGPGNPWYASALVLAVTAVLLAAMAVAWRDPSHPWVRKTYYLLPLLTGAGLGLLHSRDLLAKQTLGLTTALLVMGVLTLWFVILHRHQHVLARLREADEQAKALALTRRLATAQIQPHFLFNALATLQQWVATQDVRAAPLLDALTGYLRATLPLFDRDSLSLAEEGEAVRQYLTVMQARLGTRLAWRVTIPPELATASLPPGVLLTLVENAIEHGVQALLHGGQVTLAVRRAGTQLIATVADDGPGAPPELLDDGAAPQGHYGLANTRARLAAVRGRLTLTNPPTGGCTATLTWTP